MRTNGHALITLTLSITPGLYSPAEVTPSFVVEALKQRKSRNERLRKYMAKARAKGKPW